MDAKLMSDSIASIRKALEEFITPSFHELRSETHADTDQLRADIDKLDKDIAQLRDEAAQARADTASHFAQVRDDIRLFRAETAANLRQVRDEAQQFRAETTIQFVQVRGEISGLRSEVNSLRSTMERGFSEIGAKLDMQADVQRLKEQVASLQAGQQTKALEAH